MKKLKENLANTPNVRLLRPQFPVRGSFKVEYSGSTLIAADRQTVWAAINDTATLQACIPGCTEFDGSPEDGYSAVVTQKIGPVKATFRGSVQLQDLVRESSCTIIGEGKGGAAGFAKGSAKVSLSDAEGGTELAYEVDARVGGKIAQIGSRLVKGAAKKVADEFFRRLQARVGENSQSDEAAGTQEASDSAHSQ